MITNIIEKVKSIKNNRIKDQNYEAAAQWRDLEKCLMQVEASEVKMNDFLDNFKNEKIFIWHHFKIPSSEEKEMWEIIKILDTKEQRKRKLKEIGL